MPAQPTPLFGRRVVLGVTGSIAAYKAIELARRLEEAGETVDVVLTEHAERFAPALTFRSLVRGTVANDMFAEDLPAELHVELGRRADLLLVAPATATTLAKLAVGIGDSLVTLTALATTAPVLIAPAMDSLMYGNAATQANLTTLRARGITFVGPEEGRLASGESGAGRMTEPAVIVGAVRALVGRVAGDMSGRHVVVSAGGTREAIDPVRFLGNRSSGKMGFALAAAARDRGAAVSLVSTQPPPPDLYGISVEEVETAEEMRAALERRLRGADVLVMAAAVADFRPAEAATQKHKRQGNAAGWELTLLENPDLVAGLRGSFVKVGFAAETNDLIENAAAKLSKKGLDLVVANDVTDPESGFGRDTNRIVLIDGRSEPEALPLLSKYDAAQRILDRVAELLAAR
jgi:phosphopantothenoylcysteine decarboxylase/phosphopantothenate--cysteine ligase